MAWIAIIVGDLLVVLGVVGYVMSGAASITALIPAFFGLPIALLGVVAWKSENLRMHAMHGAVTIGLLGMIGAGVMGGKGLPALLEGTAERPMAVAMQLVMAVICFIFVVLCVKSFIDARKNREKAAARTQGESSD